MRRVLKGTGKALKWTFWALVVLIVVTIAAAIIGLGSASDKSEKAAKQITPAKYAAVHTGMSRGEVRALLGKPESTDATEVSGLQMSCWYYGVLASSSSYQFCFQNGKLESKSRY